MFILSGTLINILKPRKAKRKKKAEKSTAEISNCKSCTKTRSETAKNALIWSN